MVYNSVMAPGAFFISEQLKLVDSNINYSNLYQGHNNNKYIVSTNNVQFLYTCISFHFVMQLIVSTLMQFF